MEQNKILLQEDFSFFPIGPYPFDPGHTALGEYHYLTWPGETCGWHDPVVNYFYTGPSWMVTSCDGVHHLEQTRLETTKPHITHPMLCKGDERWRNYTFSAKLRLLNTRLPGEAGIGFAYQNSLQLYVFVLSQQEARLLYRHKEEETLLAKVPFVYTSDRFYTLSVQLEQNHVACLVDQAEVLTYTAESVLCGKVALTANLPAQFESARVICSSKTALDIKMQQTQNIAMQKKTQACYPAMKLWKSIDLQSFGTGRQIRFGHLKGDNKWYIVLAQCQKRICGDAYCKISCLTAIDLGGNVLWQRGEPSENPDVGLISCDVPLQLYDIDGDGKDEVITAEDFEILILDGETGRVRKRALTPLSVEADGELIGVPFNRYAFDRLNPDGIRIANFSGKARPSDLLLKDRYGRLYAFNNKLELMWKFISKKNTGHFPYALDVNGDGMDELFCGYNLISADGQLVWTLPVDEDHTDEIVPGKLWPGQTVGTFALASGTQGFLLADYQGKLLKQDKVGHAQRISVGKFCPEREGLQICMTNFWGHQGIVYLYDCHGEPIWEYENTLNGNLITPVNWKGDGTDLILLNADDKLGGLLDGKRRQAVMFPQDGHPTLCAEAIDLCADARDELVVWDLKRMWIYTQADAPKANVYAPVHYEPYNASNYRGEFHYPDASYLMLGTAETKA